MRLNKFLATNTSYSRRKADELIESGAVKVNNHTAALGTEIDPEKDSITINGKKVTSGNQKIYIALNKPSGYVTTRNDEFNRKTVMDLIPNDQNLKPVGRLDLNTEGLLLLSNDGDFINRLLHPSFECEKEYQAKITGHFTKKDQSNIEKGVLVDGRITAPSKITILKQNDKETILRIVIHEGRNRQIRKMFAQIHCHVKYLQRIRIGEIKLGDLELGQFRPLTLEEINVK